MQGFDWSGSASLMEALALTITVVTVIIGATWKMSRNQSQLSSSLEALTGAIRRLDKNLVDINKQVNANAAQIARIEGHLEIKR